MLFDTKLNDVYFNTKPAAKVAWLMGGYLFYTENIDTCHSVFCYSDKSCENFQGQILVSKDDASMRL